jgi:exoribonuclease-2
MRGDQTINLEAIARTAMERYGFEPGFSPAVEREIGTIPAAIPPGWIDGIKDLRSLLWSSIDNYDSMDLDQIEYCERGPAGEITVRIAIADVAAYVDAGTHTDRHASHNGTSVYTGVSVFPMLPDRLSHNLSSLLPGQNRLAVVIEYTVLPDGDVRYGSVSRALVFSKAKLVYEEIGAWLEGRGPLPETARIVPGLEEQLRLQHEAAERLKHYRRKQGALSLDTLEAKIVIDRNIIRNLVVHEQNYAHYLIEDFMIAGNRTMVAFLGKHGLPMIQRVVRTPRNWEGIVEIAAEHGYRLPKEPDAKALAGFLDRQSVEDPERFPDLSLTVVKLMGPGEYVMVRPGGESDGHFALAVIDYTHSTAPNRRYVDLINQRITRSLLDGGAVPYTADELEERAAWLSDREKASKKVERFMLKAAAGVLLRDRIGETFDALVTGAAEKGTWVRIIEPPVEGRVVEGERGLYVGQKIVVKLIAVDPYKGFIDFAYTGRKARDGRRHHGRGRS